MDIKSISQIRKETQLPMHECKEALEHAGNVEKAIEYLLLQKREIPKGICGKSTVVVLSNRSPYTIIDTRFGIDNTKAGVV